VKSFQSQTHYELLEISVGATSEEIRSAFERLSRLYSDDQVVLYGLIEPGQATALRERLQEALDVLADESSRAAYDESIGLPPREPVRPLPPPPSPPRAPAPKPSFPPSASGPKWAGIAWVTARPTPLPPPQLLVINAPGGSHSGRVSPSAPLEARLPSLADESRSTQEVPQKVPAPVEEVRVAAPVPALLEPEKREENNQVVSDLVVAVRPPERDFRPEPKVKPFEVGPTVEFNGDLIRQVRMARGVSLVQLAEKTRISIRHLENLEADRYDALPASVYLRGILTSVARELGLDGQRVSRSYLTFVEASRSKG